MDESVLFNGVMQAVLRRPKAARARAMGYMAARAAPALEPDGAADGGGVAWGIFETLQGGSRGRRQPAARA
jgi:hypothetical protein